MYCTIWRAVLFSLLAGDWFFFWSGGFTSAIFSLFLFTCGGALISGAFSGREFVLEDHLLDDEIMGELGFLGR
jgi:hypothetical protein